MKIQIDENWFVDFPDDFFLKPFKLRLDLDNKGFEKWRRWFFEELVKCDMWSCIRDGDSHAIEDMCGCGSIFRTYNRISEHLQETDENDGLTFYPMYDPIYAHHLPGSGWVTFNESDKEVPIEKDDLEEWNKWFPKRSCVSCSGQYGSVPEKLCSHNLPEQCTDSCFKHKFQSWCPIMNSFMEKSGAEVDRSLEKFANMDNPEPDDSDSPDDSDDTDDEGFKDFEKHVPKQIRDFLDDRVNGDENGKERGDPNNN